MSKIYSDRKLLYVLGSITQLINKLSTTSESLTIVGNGEIITNNELYLLFRFKNIKDINFDSCNFEDDILNLNVFSTYLHTITITNSSLVAVIPSRWLYRLKTLSITFTKLNFWDNEIFRNVNVCLSNNNISHINAITDATINIQSNPIEECVTSSSILRSTKTISNYTEETCNKNKVIITEIGDTYAFLGYFINGELDDYVVYSTSKEFIVKDLPWHKDFKYLNRDMIITHKNNKDFNNDVVDWFKFYYRDDIKIVSDLEYRFVNGGLSNRINDMIIGDEECEMELPFMSDNLIFTFDDARRISMILEPDKNASCMLESLGVGFRQVKNEKEILEQIYNRYVRVEEALENLLVSNLNVIE